jgi:hypothetical protein
MIVALGINNDGQKTVLGLREGATENAAVVNSLLSGCAPGMSGANAAGESLEHPRAGNRDPA